MPRALPLLFFTILLAAACEYSEADLADDIRARTPTELPPATTHGANTMGAYVHTDTGRVLFVASGVDRPETNLAASLDCNAFDNMWFRSSNFVSVRGLYCNREEIGDYRRMRMTFKYKYPDSAVLIFQYSSMLSSLPERYWNNYPDASLNYEITRDDREARVLSGTFAGRLLNRDPPYDTLVVTDGRFDVTYGVTP